MSKTNTTPVVVFRQRSEVTLPGEEADGLIVEVVGFLEPFASDHTAIRTALGLVDGGWAFHNSESLTIGVRTIPTP